MTKHKSGFVNILGKPNVGKSTLMNAFLGEKLSIITPKAQTTRHRILGIANGENYQIVFSDTPGILKPNYKLQEQMMQYVWTALDDADLFIVMAEINDTPENNEVLERVRSKGMPVLLLINKIDLSKQDEVMLAISKWEKAFPEWLVLPISALVGFNIDTVFEKILELLPESPPFYSKDDITDKPVRFFISEIIREKILMNFHQEIPYSVEVEVESYKEEGKLVRIRCNIHVARNSQKGILIGHQGKALKKIGMEARKDIETFIEKQVFLELYVKVSKNWREDEMLLKRFGYK